MYLKYYKMERERFSSEHQRQIDDVEATAIFKKLKSKHKIRQTLYFRGWGGSCSTTRIRLGHKTNVLILAHEFAHALQFRRLHYKNVDYYRFHGKKHFKLMSKLIIEINNILGVDKPTNENTNIETHKDIDMKDIISNWKFGEVKL